MNEILLMEKIKQIKNAIDFCLYQQKRRETEELRQIIKEN